MGCVLGLLGSAACSGLACCCTGSAVACCCHGCCSCKNSTSTRIVYASILFLGLVIAGIFLIPKLQPELAKIPGICEKHRHFDAIENKEVEDDCLYSVNSIYRVFFAIALFFFFLFLLMIDVQSSRDCRAAFQNGCWFVKLVMLVGTAVGAFFMPPSFAPYWMYICIAASGVYIIIQLILTIDFAYFLNAYFWENHDNSSDNCFLCMQVFVALTCYGLAIGIVICLFIFYTSAEGCSVNKAILIVNIILCFGFSIVSVLEKIKERVDKPGLLQSSIISLYVMFITWSAFSNQPDRLCNPGFTNIIKYGNNKKRYESDIDSTIHLKAENILAVILSSMCILYSALKNSSESSKLFGSNNNAKKDENDTGNVEDRGKAWDDETEETKYNYAFFHFIMFLASMYLTMCFTNWIHPESKLGTENFNGNATAYWFKVVSSWLCALLYTWTLVAPFVFPEREFG